MEFVSSGSTLLNLALTGKPDCGYPIGRIVNVVGDKSTGKTLLAIEAITRMLRVKGDIEGKEVFAFYDETEASFDKSYAEKLGMPVDDERLSFVSSTSIEDFFNRFRKLVKDYKNSKTYVIYVLDSLDALPSEAELKRDISEGSYGTEKAKILSAFFRQLVREIENTHILLFIISQVRDNIGVLFGERHRRAGGKALDFYASQVIWLSELGKITRKVNGEELPVGLIVRAKTKKNKVYDPLREVDLAILFGYGLDDVATCFMYANEHGLLGQSKGWYDFAGKKWRKDELLKELSENDDLWSEFRQLVVDHWLEKDKAIDEMVKGRKKRW